MDRFTIVIYSAVIFVNIDGSFSSQLDFSVDFKEPFEITIRLFLFYFIFIIFNLWELVVLFFDQNSLYVAYPHLDGQITTVVVK